MIKKYLDGSNLDWIKKANCKTIYLENKYKGYLAVVNIEKVYYKLYVDYDDSNKCLIDDGYTCISFLPTDEYWCCSVIYNKENQIVEWYFDITYKNKKELEDAPYFNDMYLDIAVSPNFKISILDEDEILDALNNNLITKKEYDIAYETCDHLIKEIIPNKSFMLDFFNNFLE